MTFSPSTVASPTLNDFLPPGLHNRAQARREHFERRRSCRRGRMRNAQGVQKEVTLSPPSSSTIDKVRQARDGRERVYHGPCKKRGRSYAQRAVQANGKVGIDLPSKAMPPRQVNKKTHGQWQPHPPSSPERLPGSMKGSPHEVADTIASPKVEEEQGGQINEQVQTTPLVKGPPPIFRRISQLSVEEEWKLGIFALAQVIPLMVTDRERQGERKDIMTFMEQFLQAYPYQTRLTNELDLNASKTVERILMLSRDIMKDDPYIPFCAAIYIDRIFKNIPKAYLLRGNFDKFLITACLMAQKMWRDVPFSNKYWAQEYSPFLLQEEDSRTALQILNAMEAELFQFIELNGNIETDELLKYFFIMKKIHERPIKARPPEAGASSSTTTSTTDLKDTQ